MPKKTRTDKALNLFIPPEWHEALREQAFHDRRSIAELVRDALKKTYGYVDPPEEGKKGGEYRTGGLPAMHCADRS